MPGTYTVSSRVASPYGINDAMHIDNAAGVNLSGAAGVNLSGAVAVPKTGRYSNGWNFHYTAFT